jgi:hypothetical protein
MHNKNDGIVGFDQGEHWFNGLSRVGKKVWMISYEGENHTIEKENNQLDYSIRLGQFFDHYLKGAPPPKWMTGGRFGLQAKDNDLDLDNSGSKP